LTSPKETGYEQDHWQQIPVCGNNPWFTLGERLEIGCLTDDEYGSGQYALNYYVWSNALEVRKQKSKAPEW
jgi:hypothetical protein